MKAGAIAVLAILIVLLMLQVRVFYRRSAQLARDLAQISAELAEREAEYQEIRADYEYYQHPENLEKELRGRFNYKRQDETLVVIVPRQASTTGTSTSPSSSQ